MPPHCYWRIAAIASVLLAPTLAIAQGDGARSAAEGAKPAEPLHTETTQFGSWTLVCQEVVGGSAGKKCSLSLRMVDPQKKLAVSWIIARSAEGKMMMAIQTPTGVNITQGVELKVGRAAAQRASYVNCEPQMCEAIAPLGNPLIDEAKTAREVMITIQAKDLRKFEFKFDNKGFGPAIAALMK